MSRRSLANLCLAAAIVAEVSATLSLKAAVFAPGFVVIVVIGYTASFYCLALTLRFGKGLAAAYGIWGASGVVLTAAASSVLFAEHISPRMALGFAMIAAGVVVVEVASGVRERKREREAGLEAGGIELNEGEAA